MHKYNQISRFFFLSLCILMKKMMAEQMVVITLVSTNGMLPRQIPCITKNTEPRPSIQNVGNAMASVSRVRIVIIA